MDKARAKALLPNKLVRKGGHEIGGKQVYEGSFFLRVS
jgi:hypothetical protein